MKLKDFIEALQEIEDKDKTVIVPISGSNMSGAVGFIGEVIYNNQNGYYRFDKQKYTKGKPEPKLEAGEEKAITIESIDIFD